MESVKSILIVLLIKHKNPMKIELKYPSHPVTLGPNRIIRHPKNKLFFKTK